jgi:predicted nuclease of predicted toxin-antitoxin system
VRFLLDENMSPVVVGMLNDASIETTHVRDVGMQGSSDQILDYAAERIGHRVR